MNFINTLVCTLILLLSSTNLFANSGFPVGETLSLRSSNYPDKFIRHRNYIGEVTNVASDLDKKDASFKVVAALNGKAGYISFESVNFPGYYLRHQGFVLKLQKKEDVTLYTEDASFKPTKGLTGIGYSFESSNYPGHFLRHAGFKMLLNKNDNSDLFKKDATFHADMALDTKMDGYYRLKTQFRGEGECLEGSDGKSAAKMDKQQNVSGQLWRIEPTGNGYYRLKTQFRGEEESLEGSDSSGAAKMDKQQNVSGQFWKFVKA